MTGIVRNPPDQWIRAEGVIEPIISASLFDAAQVALRERGRKVTQEEKLEPLRRLWRKHGRLTHALIQGADDAPAASSYYRWFGGLIEAYKLIGFTGYRPRRPCQRPPRSNFRTTAGLSNDQLIEQLRPLLRKHGHLGWRLIEDAEGVPSASTYYKRFKTMRRIYELIDDFADLTDRQREAPLRKCKSMGFNLSNEQMLEMLRQFLKGCGGTRLTQKMIEANKLIPGCGAYRRRFGSLRRAYRLIGYRPILEPRARDPNGKWCKKRK